MDKGTQEKVDASLFSTEERRNIVRSFIDAYIRGAVRIEIGDPGPGQQTVTGRTVTAEEIQKYRSLFQRGLEIAVGAVKATEAEVIQTIDALFRSILAARMGERIKGDFLLVPNVESRFASLEGRVDDIERLLEELQNLIRIRGQSQ